MRIWLVSALASLTLACGSKKTEQALPRSEQPAPAVPMKRAKRAELLTRLDAAIAKASPTIAARLRPGATVAQIAAFETYFGAPLPDALKDLYRWHDGVETNAGGRYAPPDLFFDYWLAPLAKVQDGHAIYTGFVKDGTYAKTSRGGDGWWNDHWIPFLESQGGGTICVDTVGWSTGDRGQLIVVWHDDATREVTYRDLDAWLETYVTALEAGVLHKMSDEDAIGASERSGEEGPGYARWVAYHAEHNPGYPKRLRAVGGH